MFPKNKGLHFESVTDYCSQQEVFSLKKGLFELISDLMIFVLKFKCSPKKKVVTLKSMLNFMIFVSEN